MKNLNLFWYLIIFLAAVVVISLPTKEITIIPENSMLPGAGFMITRAMFRAEVITQYPNYLVGVSIIGGLALIGAFLNTNTLIKLVNKIKAWNEKSNHTD